MTGAHGFLPRALPAATRPAFFNIKQEGRRKMSESTVPKIGDPATIHYVNDSRAAVVVKVNPKSVVVRRVERIESSRQRINSEDEPFPCWAWDGDLSKPVGEPQRFPMVAPGRYRAGSIGLSLGRSVQVTDYRY